MTVEHIQADAVSIAQKLIRCPSITPHQGGALDVLEAILRPAGFACQRLPFEAPGTPRVDNLFAVIGSSGPHLCFAGHTDVVPPGDEAAWTHPPFSGEISGGKLYGRGAADMKGGIAAFVAAALDFLRENGGRPPRGSISFLITGDEEGPAINGTAKVLEWMAANGHKPDHCLLGEPSNTTVIGEEIKIGRRGSFSAELTITGVQGHVAYPQFFKNPVTGMVAVLSRLKAEPLDAGSAHFTPSNFEITSIDAANPAHNVVPARISARINIRFNDLQTPARLEAWLHDRIAPVIEEQGLGYSLALEKVADCFYTSPGAWVGMLSDAIRDVTGLAAQFSTKGGASDGRFIKAYMPVVEFGLCNETIHKVDEHVPIADLHAVAQIYSAFLRRYFA